MQIDGHDIGVCSWSLKPKSLSELCDKVKKLGLVHVQLALAEVANGPEEERPARIVAIKSSGLHLTAGMIHFAGEDYSTIQSIHRSGGYLADSSYVPRRDLTIAAAKVCKELGLGKLSTHIGFVPLSSDGAYDKMVGRVGEIANELSTVGVSLLMETGQESASALLQFLNDLKCRNVGINFDPANMILYGAGDPIDAIRTLGRHIWHVHVKDAVASDRPGTNWGSEVPFGSGDVPVAEFLNALEEIGYRGPLVIEREAGYDRSADVATAIDALRSGSGN